MITSYTHTHTHTGLNSAILPGEPGLATDSPSPVSIHHNNTILPTIAFQTGEGGEGIAVNEEDRGVKGKCIL